MLAQKMQNAVDAFIQYRQSVNNLLEANAKAQNALDSGDDASITQAFNDLAVYANQVALAEEHIKGVCLDMLCALEANSIQNSASYRALMERIAQ